MVAAGMISGSMERLGGSVRAIREELKGWVDSARSFGESIAAGLQVVGALSADGKLLATLGDGLKLAFGGAIDYLSGLLVGLASAFASGMMAAVENIGDKLNEKLFFGKKAPPLIEAIRQAATGGFAEGMQSGNLGLSEGASKRLRDATAPAWNAATGKSDDFFRAFFPAYAAAACKGQTQILADQLKGIDWFSNLLGEEKKKPAEKQKQNWAAADDYAKIGLYVGSGGAQGESLARKTADACERSAKANEEMSEGIREWSRNNGPLTFGGR